MSCIVPEHRVTLQSWRRLRFLALHFLSIVCHALIKLPLRLFILVEACHQSRLAHNFVSVLQQLLRQFHLVLDLPLLGLNARSVAV